MTLFDGKPHTETVTFAVPKTGRIVRGTDIAKTVARPATDAERWRYGVEVRRIGSRWCPQKVVPHYPVPEPYVYRKQPQPLSWRNSDDDLTRIARAYTKWLAARDKPKPEPKETIMANNVVPIAPARASVAAIAGEASRRQEAAELLREIAGKYGPRRAHKLRAMADWLTGAAAPSQRETA